jgi:hypothetical protein
MKITTNVRRDDITRQNQGTCKIVVDNETAELVSYFGYLI